MRATVLFGILSIGFSNGAFAAETYVSLGLGVAEDRVDLRSAAPSFGDSCDATALSIVPCIGGLTVEPATAGFDLGNSIASTAGLGLEWESWRIEVEYAGRKHDGQSLPQPANPLNFLANSIGFGLGAGQGTIGLPIDFFLFQGAEA